MQGYHGIGQSPILIETFVCRAHGGGRPCASYEAWVGCFQSWQEDCEQKQNSFVVLPVMKSVTASPLVPEIYVHAIKVPGIKVRAFRVIHPRNLVPCLWSLGTCLYPLIEIASYRCHLPVKFSALLGRAIQYILVDAEDCLVDARVDLVKLDNVYERLDIRPFALSRVTSLFVCERPKLSSGTWKL